MKKHLVIIGGGFAGFWSAISSIRQSREIQKRSQVDITLINPDNQVTIRPKLNESSLKGLQFDLNKYLKPLGVHQIVGSAEIINPDKNEVTVSTVEGIRNLNYDYLILSAGASLNVPEVPGINHAFNVYSSESSQRLEEHIIHLAQEGFSEEGASTFIVSGSEFAGLEIVTGLEQKIRALQVHYPANKWDFRIILLENNSEVGAGFSKECKDYIRDVIALRNVEVIKNTELSIIGRSSVLLSNGTRIATRTVIWTEGLTASSLTRYFNGPKDDLNRLVVSQFLKLPLYDNVIAAGNVAHGSGANAQSSLMDCQYAQFEGRWAGHNAINDLFGISMKQYVQPDYVNCVDLGEQKIQYNTEWEMAMQEKREKERATEKHINAVTMYPWQNVEETVKASYPEIPKF